ncbi:hypothetical protein JXO52_10155 [bacterium]|nr:hypothetical protein [bacterium]
MFQSTSFLNVLLSILFFPLYFQSQFIDFSWGVFDPVWMQILKRVFLLLPVLILIGACWLTIVALLTVVFRHKRQHFIVALVLAWWDLGKSIVAAWGGVFRFLLTLIFTILGLLKLVALWLWSIIRDIIFLPFRLLGLLGKNVATSTVPWVAVVLTLFWCIIEATIFTYVMTPLVIDVFSNITGTMLSLYAVRIPLFIFLFFIVLGSYAVLSSFLDTAKQKKISSTIGIGFIEVIVLMVEVLFLYREFVDSLVPWFAQYSENFELGIAWTILIAAFVWFGIRSLSWFLFAEYGTPTLLAIIQGKGILLEQQRSLDKQPVHLLESTTTFLKTLRSDSEWIRQKGEDVVSALMLPPLQVIAAGLNFIVLLLTAAPLFEVPFESIRDIRPSSHLVQQAIGAKGREPKSASRQDDYTKNREV